MGTRPPAWVREAYADYTRRLGSRGWTRGVRLELTLVEIEPGPRSPGRSPQKAIETEARKLVAALRAEEWVVALDERGTQMSTRELAEWLDGRMREGRDLAFLIGGPDGLGAEVLARSNASLSLSRLTLPTVMVVHVNHANEIDAPVAAALAAVRAAGVTLLNQAVLLRGVNDSVAAQTALSETLFTAGVMPYYLHMLDRTAGTAHFEVDETRARSLYRGLQAALPGYLLPRLVREIPGEPAKTPLFPV